MFPAAHIITWTQRKLEVCVGICFRRVSPPLYWQCPLLPQCSQPVCVLREEAKRPLLPASPVALHPQPVLFHPVSALFFLSSFCLIPFLISGIYCRLSWWCVRGSGLCNPGIYQLTNGGRQAETTVRRLEVQTHSYIDDWRRECIPSVLGLTIWSTVYVPEDLWAR